ncbi:hypothetical protein [Altericroceibacterium endophyticum]|uniref:Uncharacterized protein n=1 Tax=Altericroceibacterium endophyticum TaxID=1808508 RepID=A0A6I4T4T4_9SPHN|nr:hypothetical protein [Altericroceibacterium endophyticum]MXO65708.1 hypothetical protein [Altericroceibacterium endophyticum]
MATAKRQASDRQHRGIASYWQIIGVLALLAAGLSWFYRAQIDEQARAGVAAGAHIACSCHYIGGRALDDCTRDFEPGMEWVFVSQDKTNQSVTAYIPLIASDSATYSPAKGCVLDRWHR